MIIDKPYDRRLSALKTEASSWVATWMEQSKFCCPTRGFFANATPNQGTKIDHRVVLDSHARRAVRTLASGMISGLTSPSRPWFAIGVADAEIGELDEVKVWCDEVETRMMDVFSRSNIYGVLYSVYEELAVFGTASFFLSEDFNNVIHGRVYTAGEYVLGTDSRGRVNTFGREFFLKVSQIVQEFGYENVSPQTQASWNNKEYDKWLKVRMLCEENIDRDPTYADSKNMTYRCIYWEESNADKIMRQDGYDEMPVIAPRWDTTTTADAYGKGPGWDALGDVKMLQKEQRMKLEALDKVANPPIQVDASVEGEANTMPGGVTRFSATLPNAGVKPAYQINPDIGAIRESITDCRNAISSAFYADLFLMFAQGDLGKMTATEVAERQSEKLQMLGPVLERLETELLQPLIDRTFAIMSRMGLIPPAPVALLDTVLKIKYISILAQAQKMVGATAMQQVVNFVGGLAAVDPEAADLIDTDETGRIYADNLAVPSRMLRNKGKVAERREARAQAQQQAQQAQMALAMAKAGRDVAGATKDLGQTPLDGNSALDATLGAMTGRQP